MKQTLIWAKNYILATLAGFGLLFGLALIANLFVG